jgi:single-stranded-DNA-specific exonuclease
MVKQSKRVLRRALPAEVPALCDHPLLNRVYGARGVQSPRELDYQLQHLLPPESLKGLAQALPLLREARQRQASVLILGDFDADGATSTALAVRGLRALGFLHLNFLVPNRFEYGYGLTPEIVAVAAQLRPDVLITVDNGISSLEGVAAARALGMQVIITDHHLPGAHLPDAHAIINPNQPGCEFPCKSLAGVGVMFYLLMALRSDFRQQGFFTQQPEPNLAVFLDLVSLGTVADVVPLEHNNRLLVAQGLKRMQAGHLCPGIAALLQVAGRSIETLSATDLGFVVGPRLNAAGRLDDMSLGIQCLLSDDSAQALALAQELDALNRERRAIEASMQVEALQHMAQFDATGWDTIPAGLCLFHPQWHQGVIGILASRIKERFHRPVIVFAAVAEGQLKGSGRSIPGVHLRDLLDDIAKIAPELLHKFGGHAMAAGLSLAEVDLPRFSVLFEQAVARRLGDEGLLASVYTDGELAVQDFDLATAQALSEAGPWGQAFPEPLFDGEFILRQQRVLADKYLKLQVSPADAPDLLLDAIAFHLERTAWPPAQCTRLRMVYKLSVNEFRGHSNLQLLIEHLEPLGNL